MFTRYSLSIYLLLSVLVLQLLFGGCTNYRRERGVENTWRQIDLSVIETGKTTQQDVAKMFGPPSQIINLQQGPVFYYLTEQTTGGGAIFIIFNKLDEKTIYDRAVFFFDREGVLSDYSVSKESIEHD